MLELSIWLEPIALATHVRFTGTLEFDAGD